MLDVALEEDGLARLQNAISDTQQALSRQRELYAQECARTSNLTADISHQLKTPLTTLRLYTELDNAPHSEECLAQIQRMEDLIQALLRLERLCADGYAFTFETADAEAIVLDQWQSLQPLFPGKTLTISGSAVIRCDEKWLGEAFLNLLKNACEHCKSEIHVNLERTEAAFFCSIEDDGGGVSPAELPKLFERFYRSENQKGNGVGIGLAIVREIVTRHHGTITAENGEKGLRMTISMPMLDRNLTKS
jgi:signal transduction histidine kinase